MEDALLPLALVAHRTAPSVRKLLKFLTPESCRRRRRKSGATAVVREAAWTAKIKLPRLVTERLALCNSRQREVKRGKKARGHKRSIGYVTFEIANLRNNTVQIFCHTAGVIQNFALKTLFGTNYSNNFLLHVKIYFKLL